MKTETHLYKGKCPANCRTGMVNKCFRNFKRPSLEKVLISVFGKEAVFE